MKTLDHWHPVLAERALGRRPRVVDLAGRSIVLFRSSDGVAALRDSCPHRGARLSDGGVEEGRLVCPYHAWSYDSMGAGRAPGTPQLTPCVESYELRLERGVIWLRERGASGPFPELEAEGYSALFHVRSRIEAPLELLLDNFTEVEHSATTHFLFGYERDELARVEVAVELDEAQVKVENRGAQRRLPPGLGPLFGIRSGDRFIDSWVTRFSPLHTIYDQWWEEPESGAHRAARLRLAVFFVPVSERRTELWTFASAPPRAFGRLGFLRSVLLRRLVEYEIVRDQRMVESLPPEAVALSGKTLGRFDGPLSEQRRRLRRFYEDRPEL
jgi:phenylpropionate dioxygenase-like ring-hydroxylating dioxygenase large terminal subunit